MKIKHITPSVLVPALLLAGCGLAAGEQAATKASTVVATNDARVAKAITVATEPATPISAAATATPIAAAPTPSALVEAATRNMQTQVSTNTQPSNERTITITAPPADTAITSPVTVSGEANFWPFEGTLTGVIKNADGTVLGTAPLSVQSSGAPEGGPWAGEITFDLPPNTQTGTLEVFEASAKDGTITAIGTVPVRFDTAQPAAEQPSSPVALDAPQFAQDVTLPLHVALRVNPPQQVAARLVYSNGAVLEAPVPVVTSSDGVGYGVLNLQWDLEGPPPTTEPGAATLQIVDANGTVIAQSTVNVVPDDAAQTVQVAWRAGDEIIEFGQRVPPTQAVGTAALNELLHGPVDGNLAGAETALPTTAEIVGFAERDQTWGYRVQLLDLEIENGVATANFSKELRAYGGDAARAQRIREQIERTLLQFPTVERVVIAIGGDNSALQP